MKSQLPRRTGLSPVVILFALASVVGCGGNGCSCLAPIPGGFPAAERTPNAAQIRVTDTGIAQITSDPAALVAGLTGGPLTFDVPGSCGGTPEFCCVGGVPVVPCGPLVIDLEAQDGDEPRLTIVPDQDDSQLLVTMYARVHTMMPLPINLPGATCTLAIDTTVPAGAGSHPDLKIDTTVSFEQDAAAGTTRVVVGDVVITQLVAGDDLELTGTGFDVVTCAIYGGLLGLAESTLVGTFEDAIKDAIESQVCKACPGGTLDECGPFATACTDNVCMRADDTCLQEIGVTGRLAGGAVFGGFSPGTTGSLDLYEVAGGYGTTDNGGISLGLLGGMLPAGTEHDRCGPAATAPAPVVIPQSATFQGNSRLDAPHVGELFDVGIGVHQSQLDEFAYAAYDGGVFCLTVSTDTVALLTSDTIGLFIPSLVNLTGRTSPMALGLRPQSPPVIVLGKNTFMDDGAGGVVVDEPLLDITFTDLEMDFFVAVEDQYIRIMTIVADVHLPVGLQVGDEEITPVLGDLEDAFGDLSVKNNEALLESTEELADVFPTLLDLALPQIAGGLGGFAVPAISGLQLDITDITAIDTETFMAIFANLAPAMAKRTVRVDTSAEIAGLTYPGTDTFTEPSQWKRDVQPRIELALGGSEGALEWQVRVDGGVWSPWAASPTRTVSQARLWLQGRHQVEVRARRVGEPRSVDLTPVKLAAVIDTLAPQPVLEAVADGVRITGTDNVSTDRLYARWRVAGGDWREGAAPVVAPLDGHTAAALEVELYDEAGNMAPSRGVALAAAPAPFHGQAGSSGCGCASGRAGGGDGALLLVIGGFFAIGRRRARKLLTARRLRRLLLSAAFVLVPSAMPACDCGGAPPCGDVACLDGEVEMGAIGRYNGVATDGERTVVSTYDEMLGDLVLVDVVDGEPVYQAVDGIPDEAPSYHPSTYRGGRVNDGPDVGAWSSVGLHEGLARVAYQDLDEGDLRFAIEQDGADWLTYDVESDDTAVIGAHASLVIDADGVPAIAYLATGVPAADGTRMTELRLARAGNAEPGDSDWTITKLAEAVGSCAGLCGDSASCVAPVTEGDPEVCAAATSDCAATCGDTETCVATVCRTNIADPAAAFLPEGTGLFASLLVLPNGRLTVVHYDRSRTALVALVESGAGSSQFSEVVLDGADGADRGMWASAVVGGNGTIHVAYQDALTDQVFYTSLGNTAGPIELVDDGLRAPDRPHNVGAGATIFMSGTSPVIVYQDGFTADLNKATRSGTSWTHANFANGAALIDGFYLAATADGSYLVWDSQDKMRSPATGLEIREDP